MIDFCLSESKSAMLLDRFQSERAIGACARKNDADGVLSVLFGQRRKESINRSAAFAGGEPVWIREDCAV
jgi:tRNA G18 (ribose-2'-O)-methylase SpoU